MNCGTPAATAGQRSRIGKAGVGRAICQLIPSTTLLYNLRPALLPQHRGCGGGAINTWVIGVGGVVGYTLPWGLWVHSGVYTPLKATNIVGAAEQDQMKQGAINREPFTRSTAGQLVRRGHRTRIKMQPFVEELVWLTVIADIRSHVVSIFGPWWTNWWLLGGWKSQAQKI